MNVVDFDPSVGVVIATRNRPTELQQVVNALTKQSFLPSHVVVCDSSDDIYRAQIRQIIKVARIKIELIETEFRSLTVQRNLALDLILSLKSFDFIQILDDDTTPDREHLLPLSRVLSTNLDVIGVSGVTIPQWTRNRKNIMFSFILRICGIESKNYGVVTAAGIGIPIDPKNTDIQKTDWLFGCSMWRATVYASHRYNSQFLGSSLCEDIEFSTRIAKTGKLLVVPSAQLFHSSAEEGRPDPFLHSYRFTRNRICVVRNVKQWYSWPVYCLSLILLIIMDIRKRKEGLKSIHGIVQGVIDQLLRRPLR